MSVTSRAAYQEHDTVAFHYDPVTGLRAVVAIHAPRHGRGCGGCRMRPYASEDDALDDVLRLSQAMSYKAAMADVPAGGAKAVIIGDPSVDKTPSRLRAMGRFIDRFGGVYISAPDVGIGVADLRVLREETEWVVGADDVAGPSAPYTALGVFTALRAAVSWRLERADLEGIRVAVQGVGNVGSELCRLLAEAGARLTVADVDRTAVDAVVEAYGASPSGPDDILFADVDVLAPCALGGVLNDETIPRIRACMIAGAANNQLAEARHGRTLHDRGILYAPDYVASAGGLIAGMQELAGFDARVAADKVTSIGRTLTEVFEAAAAEGISASEAADRIARARIASWRPDGAPAGTAPPGGALRA
jgi:leucine dehydrogenase